MSYILTLDVDTALRLIRKAFQMREEERAFQLYASVYPNFDKKNFKKFSDFYKVQSTEISQKSSDEILEKARRLMIMAGDLEDGDI